MNFNKISRTLNKAAIISRDINAINRGPKAIGKRIGRKFIWRLIARILK